MKEKVIEWLFNGEVGISSKTISASILGVKYNDADIPYDRDDFSRCYKLIKFADIPMSELEILAKNYPAWNPIVKKWDELVYLYENNLPFYEYLKSLKK